MSLRIMSLHIHYIFSQTDMVITIISSLCLVMIAETRLAFFVLWTSCYIMH